MDILTYILSKRYIEDSLKGVGALKGKSAYEIACDNGFKGSPEEWLDSLKGETPRISDDGTWVIGEVDTGILASPDLFGYATEDYVDKSVRVVGEALAKKVDKGDAIPVPAIAAVGQTVMIKAVDENGKPTEWEAVDKPVYIANVRVDRGRYSFIDGSYETLLNAYNSGATVGLNVDSYMYYLHHIDGDNNLHFGQIPHRSIGSDHSTPNYNLMIAPDNSFTQIQMDIATEQFVRNELEKIEVSGGSGSGGVSSWNDLTDKPFYDANGSEKILPDRLPDGGVGWEGPGGKTDILPESNLVVDENTQTAPMPDGRILYGYLFLSPTIKADLTEGAEYDIAINGVVYRRVCTAPGGPDDPIHVLGNLALGEMGEDTGEDWLFYAYAGEPGFFVGVFTTTNAEYKTVAVSAEGTLIHPIEDRFIPASVARKSDVNWQAILDKPFGVTVVNLASPMTLAEMRYDGSYTAGLGFLPQRIAAGERYLVSVDGEITEWVAQQGDSGVYLGEDPRAFNEADTLPEGAYSIQQTSNSILVYLLGDRTAPIIGVAHVEIKYIDERVIPEGIARKTDIPVVPVTSVNGMTGDVVIETELDTTLTVEGKAADAKVVGDAISKISGQNLLLDTTLTQSGKAADAAAVGAALEELDEKIPTKPEDIGAQPKGDYLTAVPAGYATEEFVKNKIAEAELGGEEVDLSDYAQKSELPTKVSQLENDKGYLIAVPDGYAKTEDIPKKPADIGAQPAGNYLTSIPEEYITESELDSKGYLTDFTESDPTVPAWAKEPSKPTYTASEVGALPNTTVIPDSLADLNEDANHRLVTDTEKSTWNAKSNFSGSYDDLTNKPAIPSIAGLASTTYVDNAVKNKVDKDGNKVLSTNDYTTAEKNKLANIAAGAEVNVNADWNATSGDAQILNKPTLGSMAAKSSVAKSDLASGVQTSLGKADSALQPGDISNWAMQASKPTYTASEVGADAKGTAAELVSEHNTDDTSHNDLRLEIRAIREQLAAFLDVDEETLNELSELIARIVANQTSIAQLTTGKVNVTDIIDNLTTNVANKPLSAAQGVAIKALIDGLSASLGNYQPKGNYALASAVPTKVSQLQNDAKYLKAVTAAMITAALGYTPINPGLATLARHEDGLLYLFVDGKPVGSGVELPTGGIDGYVDADKNIVVRGLDEGVTYKFYFELADGSLVEGGELVYDNTVYYTVTNTLTNCANSNRATQVIEGESYAATITAKSGYELKTVTVTMGGSPVSVSGGKINIANVTGNIVITAVAEEKVVEPSYTNLFDPSKAVLNSRLNSAKDVVTDANATGKIITNFMNIVGKTPFTSDTKVYIKGATFTPDGNTKVLSFKNEGTTDYTAAYSQLNGSTVAVTDEGNGVISFTGASQNIASTFASDIKQMVLVLKVRDSAITTADIQDIVITIDEPIA